MYKLYLFDINKSILKPLQPPTHLSIIRFHNQTILVLGSASEKILIKVLQKIHSKAGALKKFNVHPIVSKFGRKCKN